MFITPKEAEKPKELTKEQYQAHKSCLIEQINNALTLDDEKFTYVSKLRKSIFDKENMENLLKDAGWEINIEPFSYNFRFTFHKK